MRLKVIFVLFMINSIWCIFPEKNSTTKVFNNNGKTLKNNNNKYNSDDKTTNYIGNKKIFHSFSSDDETKNEECYLKKRKLTAYFWLYLFMFILALIISILYICLSSYWLKNNEE